MPNVHELIRDHVTLSIRCLDRLYLHAYMPKLQTSGGLCYFLRDHLGHPIPSPALFAPMLARFVGAIKTYATTHDVPLIAFERGQRKDDVVADYRARRPMDDGVVVIGVAQEKMRAFKAQKRSGPQGGVTFDFSRQSVAVNHYYFYVQDPEWGPAFLKLGTYLPYPIKLCLNGHEWVKQQLRRAEVPFESLDNGFLACADPAHLQTICDQLGPADVQAFFDRWVTRLPSPLTAADRAAGYRYELSIIQAEFSLTQVLERPVSGRVFFEEVIRENLDLGRPDQMQLIFDRKVTRRTPGGFRTRILTEGVVPSLHVQYKKSKVKQYHKEGQALRTETTINDTYDFRIGRALRNLPALREIGFAANRRLLRVESLSHDCLIGEDRLHAVTSPVVVHDQRAAGLRFGDRRVHALMHALCLVALAPTGFRHREFRDHLAQLQGRDPETYSAGSMTYDLRRLRLHGLIERVPRSHRYRITPTGAQVAMFYARLYTRALRPACSLQPSGSPSAQRAFDRLDAALAQFLEEVKLAA